MLCASPRMRDTAWVPQRRSRPRRRSCKGSGRFGLHAETGRVGLPAGINPASRKVSPCIACTDVAAPSVRSRVFVSAGPSATMARRGSRASCSRLARCRSKRLVISSIILSTLLLPFDIYSPAWVGQTQIILAGGRGHCIWGQPRSPSVAC